MITLEQKHLALLEDAERRGHADTQNIRVCFEVLTLAAAIEQACAARLAPHRLSEGKFVLLFLLRDLPQGLAPTSLPTRRGSHGPPSPACSTVCNGTACWLATATARTGERSRCA